MIAMLLLSIAAIVLGQGTRGLMITDQIRVFPVDTMNVSNFSYIYRFVRSGEYIVGQTSTNNLIRSSDSGKTWQTLNLKFSGGITLALGVTDSGTLLATGLGSVFGRSIDGGSAWETIATKAGRYFTVAPNRSIISGGQDSLYRSIDDGQTWSSITDNSPFHWNTAASLFTTSKGTVLMGVGGISPQWYGVYRSTDNGFTWNIASGLPTGDGADLDCVENFEEASDGTVFAATKDAGVYKSTDDGKTWQKVPVPTTPVGVSYPSILASSNLGLFVGDGNNIVSDGLFRSTDNGATWSVFGFKGYQIGAMMQLDSTHLLANINGSIYILTLSVVSPPQIASQMPSSMDSVGVNVPMTFSVAATDPNGDSLSYTWKVNGNVVSAGCDSLIYTFREISSATTVSVVVSDASGASDSASWSFKIVTGVDEPSHGPATFTLLQNYPNPFNPTTTIQFSVQKRTIVNLTIFNVLGQKVATLVDGEKSPGSYSVQFNGSSLASGVYFYRLQAGNFVQTKKMNLLK